MKTVEESREYFRKDVFALEGCGITIDRVEDTWAQCSMEVKPGLLNAGGVVQGGAIFTLCDTAFAVAANAGGVLTVSQNASISFLRPGGGSRLTAVARQVSSGRSTCVYTVEVRDDCQRLAALSTVTGFRKPGPTTTQTMTRE